MTKTVLIVEGEKQILTLLSASFANAGWATLLAQQGKEALLQASRTSFDVAVIDLILVDLSGFDVMAGLQEHEPCPAIIVISGGSGPDDALLREARRLGAVQTFCKPFWTTDLVQAAEDALGPDASISP